MSTDTLREAQINAIAMLCCGVSTRKEAMSYEAAASMVRQVFDGPAFASSPQQVVDPVGAASEITDEQIIALWDSWPRQGITSRALAVEFARKVLATQATIKAEPAKLARAEVDALVYQCRQAGDDSTYALAEAIACKLAARDAQTPPSVPSDERLTCGAWTPVEECGSLQYGERVMVLTTDAEDEPCHELAHFNGSAGFLGINGHRVRPVTHYQRLDPPPADWKMPPRTTAKKGKDAPHG